MSEDYFDVNATTLVEGRTLVERDFARRAQVAVIDENSAETIFADGASHIGQKKLVRQVPLKVVGVVESSSKGPPNGLRIHAPLDTVSLRITGDNWLGSITVRIADDADIDSAQSEIESLMLARHGTKDFVLISSDTMREAVTSTSKTMIYLVSAIVIISLIVGGIGVMNIMLVSVTERTR